MAIKNDFVVKHGLTVTNTATINQDLIVVGSIKKNGIDVGYGYTGSQGNIGYTGSQGIQGIAGYTGSQGIQGNIGYTGSQGNIGYTGSQGAQGIAGYTGSQGAIGYTGSKGDSGLGFTIAKTYASVAALTADTTPTGIVAGQFALIETGDVENPENSRLYLWNGSSYQYTSDLSGAQGITGPQGVTGYTGSQGTQGVIGYTGSQGVIGYTGSAGPSNVLNATAASTSSVQYFVGVPATGSNQTPNASTTVPVVFQPSTGNVGIGATPSVPLEVRKSATGSNVIQRVGISGQTKNPYLEQKFDETNGLVTLNASGSSTPAFTFEIAQSEKIRIDSNGNINIPTLGARITGDFSNSTVSNRLMFQSSTANGNTLVGAVSNGTASSVGFYAFGGSDPSNVAYAGIASSNGVSNIVSGITGTGTYQPLIMTTGGAERMRIDTAGNVGVGTSNPFNASGYGSLTLNGTTGSITSYRVNGTENFRIQAKADSTELNSFRTNPLTIYTNNAERMRIDANGNVGIGEIDPAGWNSKLAVKGASGLVQSATISTGSTSADIAASTVASANGVYSASTQAHGDGLAQIILNGAAGKDKRLIFSSNNNARWICGSNAVTESGSNAGSNFVIVRLADTGAYLGETYINRANGEFVFDTGSRPRTDNLYSSGAGANRWSVVYAGTGTINTSDAREKNEVRSLTENEILAAQALSKEIGAYKFLSSIAAKGDAAREHIGMTVQRAIAVMESFGLNPFNYGFICYDEWDQETETISATEAVDAVLDEAGNVVTPAVEAKPEEIKVIREAGNRYSFRMDELSMFVARGVVARLESVEARLSALEG